jgi:hypothetical protein
MPGLRRHSPRARSRQIWTISAFSGAPLTRDAPPPCICTRRNEKCSAGQPNDVIRTE